MQPCCRFHRLALLIGLLAALLCAITPAAAQTIESVLRPGDLAMVKGRTTDHATRILFGQVGEVACWKPYCRKTMLCDICWELGASAGQDRLVIVPPPGSPAGSAPAFPA